MSKIIERMDVGKIKHLDSPKKTGCVANIKRFALHDGPGIRTTVFLKGCLLRCIWCENPEMQEENRQLMFSERICTGCRACIKTCKEGVHSFKDSKHLIAFDKCTLCGRCVEECPAGALQIVGQRMSVSEVMEIVLKDRPFYQTSSGGMTISGGEPVSQPDFTLSLLYEAKKEGVPAIVDTSGYAKPEVFDKIMKASSMLLFDIKAANTRLHQHLTGVGNELILRNLRSAAECGVETVIRIPLIPACNDNDDEIREMARIVASLPRKVTVQFLSYHSYGSHKYQELGKNYKMPKDVKISKEKLAAAKNTFTQEGIKVIDEL